MYRCVLAFASFCLFVAAAQAQATAADTKQPDAKRIEQIIQDSVKEQHFMGAVLIDRDGKVIVDKGYGSADLEWNIPNAPDTKFRLGSITKQFTAAGILLLEERGKLKLDDPISKYMPNAPAAWKSITFFHLLTHTSGIPSYTSFPDYSTLQSQPVTPEQLVARFRDKPLDFQPGEKWRYSNSGYALLGYLLEKISGEKYCDFLQQNIFTPLAMHDTGCDRNRTILPRRASGYSPGPHGLENAGYIDMTVPFSAGELYSTTGDMLRWQQGLFGGKLLTPASLKKMATPFKENYGFGLEIQTIHGHQRISHNGGINGFNTAAAWYPQEKLSIIVLSNVNGNAPDEIADRLASVMHNEPVVLPSERKEVAVPVSTLAHYAGVYKLSPEFSLTVALQGDHLVIQGTGQPTAPIFASSPTRFFARVVDAEIEFFSDASGKVDHLVLYQGGKEITGVLQKGEPAVLSSERKEVSVPVSTLSRYVGVYQLTPAFSITITLQGDHLVAQATNQPSAPIFAASSTRFFYRVVDAEIEFFPDPSGKIDHLVLYQNGRELKGTKQ
ncbi:MAG TPA: serine hydrolase [Acidobacteriaceae bacterium]|nr:serine hydrolase [Acidobacteriaceae bacterium]